MEPWKTNEALLLKKAKELEGKKLKEIEQEITTMDKKSRVVTKAGVGYVIEDYFWIKKNSSAESDFPQLGVELKTIPLKKKNGFLTVKEPLSLNMIRYMEEHKHDDIRDSSFYKKNKKMLLVCYLDDGGKRSDFVIKHLFLWKMDGEVLEELRPDYERIIKKIRAGKATDLHQKYDRYLTTCPKHGGKFGDPEEKTSKTRQPFSDEPAERRAFRLKNTYMSKVIVRELKIPREKQKAGRGSELIWWEED